MKRIDVYKLARFLIEVENPCFGIGFMNNINNIFELLREKRNQIAKENKLEPFMVLHNSVLEEIAQKQPKTLYPSSSSLQ